MVEKIETVIIGGGQAGLSLSYYLTQAGREHIVLEKSAQVADAWRNRRWDSFCLITPNWSFKLPGAEYDGSDPNGFMLKSEIVRRFEQYEQEYHLPVSCSTEVTRVEPMEDHYRYRIFTNHKNYESKNVIIATGMFQKAKIPAYAAQITAANPSNSFGRLPESAKPCHLARYWWLAQPNRAARLQRSSTRRVVRFTYQQELPGVSHAATAVKMDMTG